MGGRGLISFVAACTLLVGARSASAALVTSLIRNTKGVHTTQSMHDTALAIAVGAAEPGVLLTPIGVSLRDVSATPSQPFSSIPIQGAASESNPPAFRLPPAPSSLAIVMSGVLAFGAYHGARTLPRVHLGHVPDWYHAGARQIGHVTPLDLAFGPAMVPSAFGEPAARPAFAYRISREPCSRLRSHFILNIESPRAPPLAP